MTDFAAAAESELRAVQQELAALPLFQKYERLRDLVALYRGEPTSGGNEPVVASRFDRVREPKKINRPPSKEREDALALAADAIRGRRTPTKTAEIYEIIVPLGAKIGGAEPKGNLSAMLYHSDLFQSHGRKGWTLAEGGRGTVEASEDRASIITAPPDNVTPDFSDPMENVIG
ncbi:MAG: hypothetical protein IM674_12635 [Brevundimonas sp.]|nr:hypothetical protein [Brevundimonas sp.]